MNTQDYIKIEEQYGAHNYHPLDVVIEKAEGVWVYDVEGKKYLDCLSAYSAVNQGHVHPEILKALLDQAKKVTLTSRAFRNDQLPLLYKELSEMTGYEMSLPMNSGAEAVETAVKLARKWAYVVKKVPRHQAEIIVASNNFHGRTVTIVSFSTEPSYRDDFGPFTPGLCDRHLRRCRCGSESNHAQYRRCVAGADSRRGWCYHPARWILEEGG